uniref:Uncharacterized protein n=1 Tax=Anguilla anguilla TaxID=7936 RepID=A0A0E9VKP6_ANGAN
MCIIILTGVWLTILWSRLELVNPSHTERHQRPLSTGLTAVCLLYL